LSTKKSSNPEYTLIVKKVLALLCVAIISSSNTTNANAIFGGVSAVGSDKVLTSLASGVEYLYNPHCSMALIAPQVVVSAAHCFAARNQASGFDFPSEKVFLTRPGISVRNSNLTDRERFPVGKIVLPNGYQNLIDPNQKVFRSEVDDIAFLFLDTPLVMDFNIQIATEEDVKRIKKENLEIQIFGYGQSNEFGLQDGRPYKTTLKAESFGRQFPHPASESKTIIATSEGKSGTCNGDSGAPWYSTIDGVLKLVAVHSASNAQKCGEGTVAFGTLIYPYLSILDTNWSNFKIESENRKALMQIKIDVLNQLIRDEKKKGKIIIRGGGSCVAYGTETPRVKIQVSSNGATWTDVGTALGINKDSGCIKKAGTTHPFSYWGLADKKLVKPGMYTRWIDKDGFISDFFMIPKNPKRITINCSNGTQVRKQIGINPKCPKGFEETFDIGKPL
jgi:hypothetical protein